MDAEHESGDNADSDDSEAQGLSEQDEDRGGDEETKKRKRKRKAPGYRRNIRTKFDTVDELNPQALSAQSEELERIRRLELQQSLTTHPDVSQVPSTDGSEPPPDDESSQSTTSHDSNVVVVDLTADSEGEEGNKSAIVITEGSESEEEALGDQHPREQTIRRPTVLSKYDVHEQREDGKVLVNANHSSDEEDIFLAPQIARVAKPHQVGGIRFLFDNIIESLERYHSSDGFGCILAHSMGLGKTLQVIAFIDVFLRHTSAQRIICIVPVNTLQNWVAEFDSWLPTSGRGSGEDEVRPRSFTLFLLSENIRSMESRYEIISRWYTLGGVLLMGYEMYRLLALSVPSIGGNKMAIKKRKSRKDGSNNGTTVETTIDLDETEREMDNLIEIQQALCSPGPDLVVCDEGHRIKNDATNLSHALKKIKTRRRIVMTGYPLQNNLLEYWCMVDFVRPSYLGTKQEFMDLFERPITNGQCIDSTPNDVRLMRYRSHVLHKLLEGFVLRRGHEILRSVLPPKFEHVLFLRCSPVQRSLYDYCVLQAKEGSVAGGSGPLRAFAICSKIWNHPDIYYEQAISNEGGVPSPSNWLADEGLPRPPPGDNHCKIDWPHSMLPVYDTDILENSPKMVILVQLLELAVANGDRILVFSQSLSTLNYIERVLAQRCIPVPNSADPDTSSYQYLEQKWVKNRNYFRLDGSTCSSDRDTLVTSFNSPRNEHCWVFLLSTKAGSLGINLVGANRVIIVDVSWNPCHDSQAVCRVYRYGQTKPCHFYRLVCDGTLERKMYDRQVSKQGMADRVVDELTPERHFTTSDIFNLLAPMNNLPPPADMSKHAHEFAFDAVLTQILKKFGPWLTKVPFKHESLLIDSEDERMTDVEKYVAVKNFQQQLLLMRSGPAAMAVRQQQQIQQLQQQQQQATGSTTTVLPTRRIAPYPQGSVVPVISNVTGSSAVPSISIPSASIPSVPSSLPATYSKNTPTTTSSHNNGQEVICIDSDEEMGTLSSSASTLSSSGWTLSSSGWTISTGAGGSSDQSLSSGPCAENLDTEQVLEEATHMMSDSEMRQKAISAIKALASSLENDPNKTVVPPSGVATTAKHETDNADHVTTARMPLLVQQGTGSVDVPKLPLLLPKPRMTPAEVMLTKQDGHTPQEAAVAQALAGFVHFQRRLCKDLHLSPAKQDPATKAMTSNPKTLPVPPILHAMGSSNQTVPLLPTPPSSGTLSVLSTTAANFGAWATSSGTSLNSLCAPVTAITGLVPSPSSASGPRVSPSIVPSRPPLLSSHEIVAFQHSTASSQAGTVHSLLLPAPPKMVALGGRTLSASSAGEQANSSPVTHPNPQILTTISSPLSTISTPVVTTATLISSSPANRDGVPMSTHSVPISQFPPASVSVVDSAASSKSPLQALIDRVHHQSTKIHQQHNYQQ